MNYSNHNTNRRIKGIAISFLIPIAAHCYADDIVGVVRNNTGSGMTEVHALTGSSQFCHFAEQLATAQGYTGSNADFVMGDTDLDGIDDLVMILKTNTGSGMTEVHSLRGANGYQSFNINIATPIGQTDENWHFSMQDANHDGRPDLFCVGKRNTGSGMTEVHILDGASTFTSFLGNFSTALHETNSEWDFASGDYNADGFIDVIGILKINPVHGMAEAHVLDGSNAYQSFLLHTATPLTYGRGLRLKPGPLLSPIGDWEFEAGDYDNDGCADIYAIQKTLTMSGQTEVSIMFGSSGYTDGLFYLPTGLGEVGADWVFTIRR